MITTHTTTTTTTTERSACAELRRLLGIFAAATALTAGGCADLDDPAWAETRGETANDSFDDEDYPIGRSHELDDVDAGAWGDAAYDLDDSDADAPERDDAALENAEEEDRYYEDDDDDTDDDDDDDDDDDTEASI